MREEDKIFSEILHLIILKTAVYLVINKIKLKYYD
jgi:hypothetical protein